VVETLDFSGVGAAGAAVDSAGVWEGSSLTRKYLADFFPDVYGRKTFLQKRDEILLYAVHVGGEMAGKWFQRCAMAALVSVLVLMFVGAIVRVSGAGMGCPDWPKCWGCLIPPTKVEDVDFSKLDIEKFQRKAERMGRDPNTISEAILREEFNARHVWTEFVNRLFSLPVGLFTLLTFVLSFGYRKSKPLLFFASFAALALVLINAWMGARVVYSGLSPGVLTTHMALAFLLLIVQVFVVWYGQVVPWKRDFSQDSSRRTLSWLVGGLFVVVIAEGVMGAQVRELTDELSKYLSVPRSEWGETLEHSLVYLAHRSFSWVIVALTILAFWKMKKDPRYVIGVPEKIVGANVLAQMILGLVMSQVHIYGWVQVLHVGLAAILVASNFAWMLVLKERGKLS
jgi:cytochrome c oxidase assembly protein subunit 15